MALELPTLITELLPPTRGISLTEISVEDELVGLRLTATAPHACCPCCAIPSSSVHSRYQRCLTDLPWGTRAVHIELIVRNFVCYNRACTRRIFTERLPNLVAPSARNTPRLLTVLHAISTALGGQAGARLAARLRIAVSAATLLRPVWAAPPPPPAPLPAVGIDEGPGGGATVMAPSSSIWRGFASSPWCRTARPPASRPGSPSLRR
jgi:transposase